MLNERVRNTLVGLTMLAGIAGLIFSIALLGQFPSFQARPYDITVVAPDAGGASPGNKVNLNGVSVGSVSNVYLQSDMQHANIIISLYHNVELPNNASATIMQQSIGAPFVSITIPPGPLAPALPKDGTGKISGTSRGSSLIPPELIDNINTVARNLNQVATDLHQLLGANSTAGVDSDPQHHTANVSTLVERLDVLAKSMNSLLADPKVQGQIRDILSNVNDSSIELKNVLKNFETTVDKANHAIDSVDHTVQGIDKTVRSVGDDAQVTAQQIVKISEKLTEVLNSINDTTNAIAAGKGTTGKLINDPRLYDGLVDLSASLKSTVDDLHVLVSKWKDEGVGLHLGN